MTVRRGSKLVRAGLAWLLTLGLVGVFVGSSVGTASAEPFGGVTNFPGAGAGGYGLTTGPDGALWFTRSTSIGRITTGGTLSTSANPSVVFAFNITTGPDGALWFTNKGGSSIGRITTDGSITSYTGPGISQPNGITTGPDGALWFTNYGNNSIGRVTTGGSVSNYTGVGISTPLEITTGPDGALWFTNSTNNSIGRITTTGVVTNYTGAGINSPNSISVAPDDAMWFVNRGNGSIGRITTAGVVSNYTSGAVVTPDRLTTGPDGALWFGDVNTNRIGRITTTGSFTTYTGTGINGPVAITSGPDDAVWFVNSSTGSIGRISAMSLVPALPAGTEDVPYSGSVTGTGGVGPYSAAVIEGTLPSGLAMSGSGTITGTPHESGTFPITVRATDSSGGDAISKLSITVAAVPLAITTAGLANGQYGVPYSQQITVVGGTRPYEYFQQGGLPLGLSLSDSGRISGTPSQVGTTTFNIVIFDGNTPEGTATHTYTVTIAPPSNLTITTPALPQGIHGQAYSARLAALAGVAPYTWKKITKLPKGLKLNAKTGLISGRPKSAGTTSFTVRVQDKAKAKVRQYATKTFTIVIG